jgi:hypothetical protein
MFNGWLMFAGTEVANATRTVAYVRDLLPALHMRNNYSAPYLNIALADNPYTNPITDVAPWYDPDVPETGNFYGMFPLAMEGFTDATTSSTVGESIFDGGFVSQPRRGTREMRVSGVLVGKTEAALDAGMAWLKSVTFGSECGSCGGDEVCFLAYNPNVNVGTQPAAATTAFNAAVRHLRDVTVTEGPTVVRQFSLKSCNAYAMQVEFTMVAATPFIYTEPAVIASAVTSTLTAVAPNALIFPITTIALGTPPAKPAPIADPDCPPLPAVPKPPALSSFCGTTPASFYSYAVYIPESSVQTWKDGVIQLTLTTGSKATRYLRVRLLPRPLPGQQPADLDKNSQCGAFLLNYIPPNTKALIDGMNERVTFTTGASPAVAADHLVSGIGSEIFQWPLLSCGMGYYMLIDMDTNALVSMSLSTANRE